MTGLRIAAHEYLATRRALGFKLNAHQRLLDSFIDYLHRQSAETITIELAVAWATQPVGVDPLWWSRRLCVVRGFARHMRALDPETEIPPADLLPMRAGRITPHLYSSADVSALLETAGAMRPRLHAATYQTLIGLLAVTGMRVGEACRLDRDDIDLTAGVLTITNSKFGKSRQIPSMPAPSRRCAAMPICGTRSAWTAAGSPASSSPPAAPAFGSAMSARGSPPWPAPPASRFLPDGASASTNLRHSFAVGALLDWYRASGDTQARLPLLTTYLGHVDPKSTYWYLQATPELLGLAAKRLEHHQGLQS